MINQKLIDEEYSFLGDMVFIDNSTVCLPPIRVQKAWKDYIEGYVKTYDLEYPDYFSRKLKMAREEFAKLFGVTPEEIAFTHSASDSITMLANSFPFEKGDNVIISSEEHASNAVPWFGLDRLGVEIRVAEGKEHFVDVNDLLALADEHTRIIATASLYFCSGYAIDLKRLGAECMQRGIVTVIDGTQSAGRMVIKPKELGIDFIAGGGHKGLLGTKSVGFAYCSKELLSKLHPYTGSLQGVVNAGRPCTLKSYAEIQWRDTAEKLESGNYPYGTIEAAGVGVSLINELGIENIEQRIHETEAALREKIAELPLKVLTPPVENRAGMIFVYFPETASPDKVREILLRHKVRAIVRFDYIRMGLHFMNTPEQMDQVASALLEISKL